eukprot:c34332_g1_i1.p1 GENE.c34332_g1_i1~~c34332_g1_i1.p1  ORF type:complete len:296 (-),score=118.86 c34332_g1_i1:48-935(-)
MKIKIKIKMQQSAATIICLRRKKGIASPKNIMADIKQMLEMVRNNHPSVPKLMSRAPPKETIWEVLMGQSEVQNWLRSSSSEQAIMRYPGEYKFPGGVQDEGESLEATAIREFEEEFLIPVPKNTKLRLFNIKQTKVVRGKSFLMYNFVLISDENPWLDTLDVNEINSKLQMKKEKCLELVNSKEFWSLSPEEKSNISPEVNQITWLDTGYAAWLSLTTRAEPIKYVNEYQKKEFERLGVTRRDPMFQTMATLLELLQFQDSQSIIEHCEYFEKTQNENEKEEIEIRKLKKLSKL